MSLNHNFSHWTLDTDVPCAWLYCTMLLHSSFLVLCVACLCISNSNIVLACSKSSAHHKFWTEKACYTIVTWSCLKIGYPQIWWSIIVYHSFPHISPLTLPDSSTPHVQTHPSLRWHYYHYCQKRLRNCMQVTAGQITAAAQMALASLRDLMSKMSSWGRWAIS